MKEMKLWLVRPATGKDWSKNCVKLHGTVVRASTEYEARYLTHKNHGDEGPDVWFDQKKVEAKVLSIKGDPELILSRFLPG